MPTSPKSQTRAVGLEEVYVDSPTHLSVSVEVRDWQVVDWWLTRTDQNERDERTMLGRSEMSEQNRLRPEALGYERAPFEVLVGQGEAEIESIAPRILMLNRTHDILGRSHGETVRIKECMTCT